MKALLALSVLTLVGCSSKATFTDTATGGFAGTAGIPGGTAGAGGEAGSVSTGGVGGMAGTAGTAGTAGVGGMAGGPGGAAGSASGGTGGTCVPKTCETYSWEQTTNSLYHPDSTDLACGVIDDSCGNVINCGNCLDPMQTCGASSDPVTNTPPGIPNICAGRCYGNVDQSICPGTNYYVLTCTVKDENIKPNSDKWQNCTWLGFSGWCCKLV